MEKIIMACDVNFSYEKNNFSLKSINFSVDEGDFVSVIGRNGSGKSTIVKILSRIIINYKGSISYQGREIDLIPKKEFSKNVSYLPQSGILINEGMNVFDLLLMGRYSYKKFSEFTFSKEDKNIVVKSIEIAGIKNLRDKYFYELSGGEKQKALITLSLVQLDITNNLKGKVLIIDEPLTYLDVNFQFEIFTLLKKLNQEQKLTIIVVTHDLNLALKFTGKTILLENGRIISMGETVNMITKDTLKKHFLINSQIINFENKYNINFNPL
ncbi:ABC transporter ATP-binding protein [Bacteroidota bacterium]